MGARRAESDPSHSPEATELADRVYEPDELFSTTLEYARGLAQNSSPLAMGVMERQVYAAQESSHEEARQWPFGTG